MRLDGLDWLIVVVSLLVTFTPVIFYYRRAGRGTAEFFASGRAAPWWLIGTSMVATTFSTDTPNLVTDFVRSHGVAKNWAWWSFLLTGMCTVFLYARLWRRSGVLTDLEFYELRYSGKSAAFLRGFRAIYLGLLFNCVIMATVTLAAAKIANVMLGWDRQTTVWVCALICIVFGSLSGLWGVLTTDLLQFALAMVGVIAAAWFALDQPQVGGLAGLMEKLRAAQPQALSIVPDFGNWQLALDAFLVPLLVGWWSFWYPGAEPGGGSYIAQRMLAARSEKDALAGTLWFNLAHYALRPWPWIIVALCSLLVFPTLADIKNALPHVSDELIGHDLAYPAMLTLLPHGLLGLLVASLLAAYVSTMTTHMNWGASYLVNDFYRRFLDAGESERSYVWLGRGVSALLMALSGGLMFALTTAREAFTLLVSVGAGTGLIYLLRWFWWRVNAWSEISAMIVSFLASAGFFVLNKALAAGWSIGRLAEDLMRAGLIVRDAPDTLRVPDWATLVGTAAATTVCWLVVTFLTPPTERATLVRFCRRVRPAGAGWAAVRREAGVDGSPDSLPQGLLGVVLGCTLVYSALFGAGSFVYGNVAAGGVCAGLFAVSGIALSRLLAAMWRGRLA